jgi:hypothetical protein
MLGRLAFLSALVFVVGGCAGSSAKGMVSGRVLIDGKPLPGGNVTFRSTAPNSFPVTAKIDEAGNYPQVELPTGEVMVMIDNLHLKPRPPRGPIALPKGLSPEVVAKMTAKNQSQPPPPPADGKYVPIPDRYPAGSAEDLKFTVQPGEQTHDIELKSP